jgi:hypothetical protein
MSRRVPYGGPRPEWPSEPEYGQGGNGDQEAQRNGYGQGGNGRGAYGQEQPGSYPRPGYGPAEGYGRPQPYGAQGRGGYQQQDYRGQGRGQGPDYGDQGYADQPTQTVRYPGNGDPRGNRGGQPQGNMRRYEEPQRYGPPGPQGPPRSQYGGARPPADDPRFAARRPDPEDPSLAGGRPQDRPPPRKVRFRRTRRFFRRPAVRVISAVVALLLAWLTFSVGQAAFKNNGQGVSANVAEWARDHYLGPIVTFGEWLTYSPPKTGGKPSISYAVPSGEAVTPVKPVKGKKGFVPDIPAPLKPLAAGPALPGEGQWRVAEKVNGYPAILTTLLRDGGQYTSYSNGIASFDQRLVTFSLRPGTEDPGAAKWGVPNYIPKGHYTGLLATFNGGFKLDSAGGGFYLNGIYHGTLVQGAATIVYYKNGTIKIGEWGRDFTMNSSVAGVRQNLKLLVDHGKTASNANANVLSNWGATLGGSAWVWRSGLGITKDGRIVYAYGQALDAEDLALLLQRAGAVEGMQLDINPAWMKFDLYTTHGNSTQPSAVPLLPNQYPTVYSYLTPSTRDFTAVYAR